MKLKFKSQDFQTDAVNAIADLFIGQNKGNATFSIVEEQQINLFQNEFGVGNAMLIESAALLANMNAIQRRNKLPLTSFSASAEGKMGAASRSFCVEMETGTGKTYVYTKTIFELNKRYGFTKFIVVVPSVAIREGVYKTFQITAEHFGGHYDNAPFRSVRTA